MSERLERLARALSIEDPTRCLHLLTRLYQEVDEDMAKQVGFPCHSGCDACCHESVFVSAPEFLAVVHELWRSCDAQTLATITDEMCHWAETFRDELEMLETIEGDERDEVALRVRFQCPLLENHRCRVYRARELNARTFGASRDGQNVYGCELTRAHVRRLPPTLDLPDARAARRKLAQSFPEHTRVHVYPWWFEKYRAYVLSSGES